MATPTASFGFLKPGTGESADITVLDSDMDKIDAAIVDPASGTIVAKDAQGVVGLNEDTSVVSAIAGTDTLLTIIASVNLVSGRTYRIGCDFNMVTTSTGANQAYQLNFKTSATSDNTVAGTTVKSFTGWTAPTAGSGKDDFFEHTFKATTTGAVNVKCTTSRLSGTDTYSSNHRNFYIEDCGSRV